MSFLFVYSFTPFVFFAPDRIPCNFISHTQVARILACAGGCRPMQYGAPRRVSQRTPEIGPKRAWLVHAPAVFRICT